MKKYWVVFVNTLQKALMYRFRISTWAVINAISPLIMISVWSKYYADGGNIKGLSLNYLLGYYLAVLLIGLWNSKVNENVKEDIKDGELSNYIIKPLSYFKFRFFWESGWYVTKSIIFILPILTLIGIFTQIKITNLLLGFAILVPTYILSFFMSMFVGLMAFFITETVALTNINDMVKELFTGKVFPITFFPVIVQNILNFLPFKYMVFFPVQIILGLLNTSEIILGLSVQIIWILVLYLACKFFWVKGIKKFSGVGL